MDQYKKKRRMSGSISADSSDSNDTQIMGAVAIVVQPSLKNIIYIDGDMFNVGIDLLVHQTNCISLNSAKGLYNAVVSKYPYAHIYGQRLVDPTDPRFAAINSRGNPGDININYPTNGMNGPIVVGINGQYGNGRSQDHQLNKYDETHAMRELWFQQGLSNLKAFIIANNNACANNPGLQKINIISFPYNIGCGHAGGKWENYKKMIETFAEAQDQFIVHVYRSRAPNPNT